MDISEEDYYQKTTYKLFQDNITKLLVKNSTLTQTQFEILVIDMLSDLLSDNKVTFNEKTKYRPIKTSRGSFSRSLSQARANVISSIFTIILLSYIGVFESKPFEEYTILGEKLNEYSKALENGEKLSDETMKQLEISMIEGISRLLKPRNIKIT